MKFNKIPIGKRKYRISIVESMKEAKVLQYGFEKSYFLFERSINHIPKEGDIAEAAAVDYLKKKNMLSNNYATNRVITLNTIRIEADVIDYDNKVVYETKSRKTGIQAKMAIKKKWAIFEHDKKQSRYQDFKFVGIVVSNYESGMKIKGLATFEKDIYNKEQVQKKFDDHYKKIDSFRTLKK